LRFPSFFCTFHFPVIPQHPPCYQLPHSSFGESKGILGYWAEPSEAPFPPNLFFFLGCCLDCFFFLRINPSPTPIIIRRHALLLFASAKLVGRDFHPLLLRALRFLKQCCNMLPFPRKLSFLLHSFQPASSFGMVRRLFFSRRVPRFPFIVIPASFSWWNPTKVFHFIAG